MFDPHDYFKIIRNRTVCPVHGTKDRNLEIKRHRNGHKWVFNCYSHNCTLKEIAAAAGFNAAAIFDEDRDPDWQPLTAYISTVAQPIPVATKTREVVDLIEDTFGPNPCTRLHLQADTEDLYLPCDSKRCEDCGPRKQATMTQQLEATMGEYTYIQRIETKQQLERTLARVKKQAQRAGDEFKYQSTGDDYLGHILISNLPTRS